MRILAVTDPHTTDGLWESLSALKKKHKPDVLCCCGDISIFGHGQEEILDIFKRLRLPTFLVHGNHDDYQSFAAYCDAEPTFHNLHKRWYEFGGYVFLGYGGEGFRLRQPEFDNFSKKAVKALKEIGKPGILLTHQPLYGTTMDVVWDGEHVGSKSFRAFVKKNHSLLALVLSGHIHEGFLKHDKIGGTAIINPGSRGIVIDLA